MATQSLYILISLAVLAIAALAVLALRRKPGPCKPDRSLADVRNEAAIFRVFAEQAQDGLILQDMSGKIEWCNSAYERQTGYTLDEIRGRNPQEFILPETASVPQEAIDSFRFSKKDAIFHTLEQFHNRRKDGSLFWMQIGGAIVPCEGGEDKVVLTCRDVTSQVKREATLKKAKNQMEHQAGQDALTGLANRLRLTHFMNKALADADDMDRTVGVIHLDLDHFKEANDTFGHAAGDAVLIQAARTMERAVRSGDLVARVGGDEFVIVCPNSNGFAELEQISNRIIADVSKPMKWQDAVICVGVSAGAAISDPGQTDAEQLIQKADFALYEVKRSGRGKVASFDETLDQMQNKKETAAGDLALAIKNRSIGVFFQPVCNVKTKEVVGFECLMRWHHPERGMLSPAEFFDIAEDLGLMIDLDRHALRAGLDGLRHFRDLGYEDLSIGINVSPSTLGQDDFVDVLKWETDSRDLSPDAVVIEVMEAMLLAEGADGDRSASAILALSQAGFRTQLDDFGFSTAGLSHLAHYSLSGLKIDRSMINGILDESVNRKLTRTIIGVSSALDLDLVACGVETEQLSRQAYDLGCHVQQGFALARPMDINTASRWLDTGFAGLPRSIEAGAISA